MRVSGGALHVHSSRFDDNGAATSGGAAAISGGEAVFVSCTFRRNRALRGGALAVSGAGYAAVMAGLLEAKSMGVKVVEEEDIP